MIPPEPGPDPPTPEVKVYTYSGSDPLVIGDTSATGYYGIQDGSTECGLTVKKTGSSSNTTLSNLIVNEVPAFQQTNRYFCNANFSICVLDSNAVIGGTHPYYVYDGTNHTMVQGGTADIISCTPSDYFANVKVGEFELEQRS